MSGAREGGGISRRAVLGAAAVGAAGQSVQVQAETSDPCLQDITHFVALGEHRCGTAVERATGDWLTGRLRGLGYAVQTGGFAVHTVVDPHGALRIEGQAPLSAFPQWLPPGESLNRTLTGPLTLQADAGGLQVVEQPFPAEAYWRPAQQKAAEAAAQAGAAALIIAMADPTDGIYACNQDADAALPLPVATVRPSDLPAIAAAARAGRPASLTLAGRPLVAEGLWLKAAAAGPRPVVISTPLTGWFTCGAERGPGIALWLHLAATLRRADRPAVLLGTGGHELGHRGMREALRSGLPGPDAIAGWVHLGAGIGASALDARFGRPQLRLMTVSPTLQDQILSLADLSEWARRAPGPGAPGEAGDVIDAGYGGRFIGLAGGFPGFHTQGDDGSAVDPGRLAAVAASLDRLVLSL